MSFYPPAIHQGPAPPRVWFPPALPSCQTANLILKVFCNAAPASSAPIYLPIMFPRRSAVLAQKKRDTPAEGLIFVPTFSLAHRPASAAKHLLPLPANVRCSGGGQMKGGGGTWMENKMHIPGGGVQFGVNSGYQVWQPRAGGGAADRKSGTGSRKRNPRSRILTQKQR